MPRNETTCRGGCSSRSAAWQTRGAACALHSRSREGQARCCLRWRACLVPAAHVEVSDAAHHYRFFIQLLHHRLWQLQLEICRGQMSMSRLPSDGCSCWRTVAAQVARWATQPAMSSSREGGAAMPPHVTHHVPGPPAPLQPPLYCSSVPDKPAKRWGAATASIQVQGTTDAGRGGQSSSRGGAQLCEKSACVAHERGL